MPLNWLLRCDHIFCNNTTHSPLPPIAAAAAECCPLFAGLLLSCIQDPDPCIFLEPKIL